MAWFCLGVWLCGAREANPVKYNCCWEGSAVFVGLPIFTAPSSFLLPVDVGFPTSFSHCLVFSHRLPVDFSTGLCSNFRPRLQDWTLMLSHLGLCLFLVRANSAMNSSSSWEGPARTNADSQAFSEDLASWRPVHTPSPKKRCKLVVL